MNKRNINFDDNLYGIMYRDGRVDVDQKLWEEIIGI